MLELNPSDFNYDAARSRVLVDNLVERIRALPGVERVALGDRIPFYVGFPKVTTLGRRNRLRDSRVPGRLPLRCRSRLYGGARRHDGVWLGLQRTGHLSGQRGYRQPEAGGAAVAGPPGGRRMDPRRNRRPRAPRDWCRHRRQAPHARRDGARGSLSPDARRRGRRQGHAVVRTTGDPGTLLSSVQDQVRVLVPSLPPDSGKTMKQRMEMPLWPARTAARFLASAARSHWRWRP